MKECSQCRLTKEFSLFNKDKYSPDKCTSRCKSCLALNRKKNFQSRKLYQDQWRQKNREYYNKMLSDWRKSNPSTDKHLKAKRRANKIKATPKWLTDEHLSEIKTLYKNCPKGYEVDHMVPLQGEEICGLHVPWNLRIVSKEENRSKSNKLLIEILVPGAA